ERLGAPLLGVRLRARVIEVGDADELDLGHQLLDGGDVELADVSRADHPGPQLRSAHDRFLSTSSSTVRATWATRADHVSVRIAAGRARRAAGSLSPSARSTAVTNSVGVEATRTCCA